MADILDIPTYIHTYIHTYKLFTTFLYALQLRPRDCESDRSSRRRSYQRSVHNGGGAGVDGVRPDGGAGPCADVHPLAFGHHPPPRHHGPNHLLRRGLLLQRMVLKTRKAQKYLGTKLFSFFFNKNSFFSCFTIGIFTIYIFLGILRTVFSSFCQIFSLYLSYFN